jgi:hypothetical protein
MILFIGLMIYPLEAVGYEESVKSPYLDLLNHFKSALRYESNIFVVGYSFRDPTIGSIFEEIIAERIRKGHLKPLHEDLNSRKNEVMEHTLKIIAINPSPEKIAENMRKQSHTNLLQTFVPIKIRFPRTADPDFQAKYLQALRQLGEDLEAMNYIGIGARGQVVDILHSKYGLETSELEWWKK